MANRDRQLAGRAGALKSWSQTSDKAARTKPGRDAFLDKFAREVDPDGTLPEEERMERALYARRAHMTKLARQSARVRREKALARKGQSDETTIENDACATISVHFRNRAGTPTGSSA